ncbi:hypothetical protein FH972_025547 [Carpinus fangiana]|uniref:Cytochrome P450 n=1 Tax=Carpinus fangiana TaxID=176857 RepID=A0A5N6L1C3_9ROSI|nr:hypothetical protein FH972_025547 [Carpinus fangiana]
MAVISVVLGSIAVVAFTIWYYIHVPLSLPKNIPRIPIYVSLLGLWSSMGQDEIYEKWLREPLERYGAVKIWFAGQWSILVTKPEYLTDMFRNEDVYAKAGSQVKIPWSVISSLVGDNIINSHGENWHLYTSIMKPGMQKRTWDAGVMVDDTRHFIRLCLQQQKDLSMQDGVMVNPLIQRWAIQIMGRNFLDTDLQCLSFPDVRLETLQSIIKRTLFKPLYFNFPHLDKYSAILRSRARAYAIMKEFGDRLFALSRALPRHHPVDKKQAEDLQVVDLLNVALDKGQINEEQFRANIKITFLTAHENAQQLLNSIFWELGRSESIPMQQKLRDEVLNTGVDRPSTELLNSMPYLTSVLYEMLRLYPPVSQLINRVTITDTILGGNIRIPKRTWVGWNAYGAHVDPNSWPSPYTFKPERWGETVEQMQSKFRRDCVAGRYIPFNAHSRKCLGQGFALLEMKVVLFELVKSVTWTVDKTYKLKLTPGGILAPLGCKVVFKEVARRHDESVQHQ